MLTYEWLKTPGLKSKTEGFIITTQDQAIKNDYYQNKILEDGTNSVCRICGQFQEAIDPGF